MNKSILESRKKLARQGCSNAQYYLGFQYGRGEGVPQNKIEAVKWYRLAAEQGHVWAQYELGIIYKYGKGVPKNNLYAYTLLSIAARCINIARGNRDRLAVYMPREQLSKGKVLINKCANSNYTDMSFLN